MSEVIDAFVLLLKFTGNHFTLIKHRSLVLTLIAKGFNYSFAQIFVANRHVKCSLLCLRTFELQEFDRMEFICSSEVTLKLNVQSLIFLFNSLRHITFKSLS